MQFTVFNLQTYKKKKILEFLENDDESEIVSHHLTNAEIISSVLIKQDKNELNSEDAVQKLSIIEGFSLREGYLKFLETQNCVSKCY